MLVGGVISLYRQGSSRVALVIVSLIAVVAAVGGVLWLLPEG
jgi:hypothetical protein